ncbi:MAG: LysE family transporter [Prolixibacteraceae bacterium]|nr:LysE family transporter [Prolixibacteraceae bacterium]MBN2648555.1 LysE family transporter [Prolixibacteraceae bacterium]
MITLLTIFVTSLFVAFSGALMPGPLLTITISESARRGAVAGPLLILGHGILELILLAALFLGLGPVLEHRMFFLIAAFAGGAIMFWMAWGMFRSLPSLSVRVTGTNVTAKSNLPLTGALMSLANPYWIIWWATIGLGYVVYARQFGAWGVVFFFTGHIAGDLIWYWAISFAVSKGKTLFTDKVYRILIGVCGGFLVLFAIYLIFSAFAKM